MALQSAASKDAVPCCKGAKSPSLLPSFFSYPLSPKICISGPAVSPWKEKRSKSSDFFAFRPFLDNSFLSFFFSLSLPSRKTRKTWRNARKRDKKLWRRRWLMHHFPPSLPPSFLPFRPSAARVNLESPLPSFLLLCLFDDKPAKIK